MAKKDKAAKEVVEKEVVEKPAKIEQNGVVRPNAGTQTARVWEIAEALSESIGSAASRKEVLEAATAEGINASTAATQYGRWTKFHGIVKAAKTEETATVEDAAA